MIKSIDVKVDVVTLYFDDTYSGVFFCFGEKIILENSNSISLKYRDDVVYNNNFKFKPDGGAETAIIYDDINFLNAFRIIGSKRGALSSPEATFFIARNIANHHDEVIRKCNATVVLGYRAIELNREDLALYSLDLINKLLIDLDHEASVGPHVPVKSNPSHVHISLQYIQSLLSLYLGDEVAFIDSLNALLNFSRTHEKIRHLAESYFTLVRVHKLIASYVGRELSFLIYNESQHLSKELYSIFTLGGEFDRIRLVEVSNGISQLSSLAAFSLMENLDEERFFITSLRCDQKNKLFSNFRSFKRNGMINLKPSSSINQAAIDAIRDKALQLEREGNIQAAKDLMKSALMARPNGAQIRAKYIQYIRILDQE